MEKVTSTVFGTGYVEGVPVANHYFNGQVYRVVSLWAPRKFSKTGKKDYVRVYLAEEQFRQYQDLFVPGESITISGHFIKSKITEALSDIAISLETVKKAAEPAAFGFKVDIVGSVVKINERAIHNEMASISFLVLLDMEPRNSRVILKFTATDKMVEVFEGLSIELGTRVALKGTLLSYQIKNRVDINAYLHDTRVNVITKLGEIGE